MVKRGHNAFFLFFHALKGGFINLYLTITYRILRVPNTLKASYGSLENDFKHELM